MFGDGCGVSTPTTRTLSPTLCRRQAVICCLSTGAASGVSVGYVSDTSALPRVSTATTVTHAALVTGSLCEGSTRTATQTWSYSPTLFAGSTKAAGIVTRGVRQEGSLGTATLSRSTGISGGVVPSGRPTFTTL